jgi:aminotransferase
VHISFIIFVESLIFIAMLPKKLLPTTITFLQHHHHQQNQHRAISILSSSTVARSCCYHHRRQQQQQHRMMSSSSSSKDHSSPPPPDAMISESVIRTFTRLAHQYEAVNLSQGFPNEPPPRAVRRALARAVWTGREDDETELPIDAVTDKQQDQEEEEEAFLDVLNQYSPPMGRPDVRRAVASYYERLYGYTEIDPERSVTLTLGATEAVASALRTIGKPGDKVVLLEPYHELYPSQCRIFYLEPIYVTLREQTEPSYSSWTLDFQELEAALSQAKIFILNSPHNPTGKVFTHTELEQIVQLCLRYQVYLITDEIYEHMTYLPQSLSGHQKESKKLQHILIPQVFPEMAERTFVCNSMGKSASATGWRLGWCIHPIQFSAMYRGVHDQLVVMAPHPVQYASLTYFQLPTSYFHTTLAHRYRKRIQILSQGLQSVGFTMTAPPEGAYYLFVKYRSVPALQNMDPMTAALFLVKEIGVACVPGNNFYGSSQALAREGQEYLRFAACRSVSEIQEACQRLQALRTVA